MDGSGCQVLGGSGRAGVALGEWMLISFDVILDWQRSARAGVRDHLEDHIGLSVVSPLMREQGWPLTDDYPGATGDPVLGNPMLDIRHTVLQARGIAAQREYLVTVRH